ncbi:MAG TPA: hypothetical protein VJ654_15675 [Noviherbaspirillum sp.]|nr:hypothetical protein [Noviherbaspirillum sp.]
MYMVYWTETEADSGTSRAYGWPFDTNEMSAALQFMEALRARQRAGEGVSFVTMSSENPHSVGHPGAADPHPDYNWKKRRK